MSFGKTKNFLVYAILFLLSWQTRWILRPGELNGGYWEYGTISIYITEVILWLAISLHVVNKNRLISNFDPTGHHPQGDKFLISNQFPSFKNRVVNYYLLLTTYYLLIGLVALRPSLHYYYLLRIAEGIGLYFLIKSVDARKASLAFILGMIPQALLGIYQFLTQSSFASTWLGMAAHDPGVLGTFVVETASGRWLRAYGGLPHPNVLGAYLVVAIMLLVNLMFNIDNKKFQIFPTLWSRSRLYVGTDFPADGITSRGDKFQNKLLVISYSLLVIFSSSLFLTFSRSAWLALFISLLVYLFIVQNKKRVICYLLFVICSFVILGSIFKEPLLSRAHGDNRLEAKSKIERITGYEEAWKLFKKHPLVGVGLGNYTYAVHKEIDESRPSFAYQPVHNIFVLLVVEAGILGILVIFSLFIYWFFLRMRSTDLISATILVIVLGLFDHYLVSLYPGIMLLCSIFGLAYINKESDPPTRLASMKQRESRRVLHRLERERSKRSPVQI